MSESTKDEALPTQPQRFDDVVSQLRKQLRPFGDAVMALHQHRDFLTPEGIQRQNEMHANLTLAYRHIEDAVMRLGKAIQAFDGGKSVYDK
jgi:hypothetical protein